MFYGYLLYLYFGGVDCMKNPYEVLGISSLDSKDVAKAKYRALCKKYHPDVAGLEGTAKFREINEAWNLIKNTLSEGKERQYWSHKTLFSICKRRV